jgi:DNA mismatch endonuclease (patch repair protein)
MVDTRTTEQRQRIMRSVKSMNTGPEKLVRKALFAAGYRYRLHRRDLPGSPDIVLPRLKKAIFVHGCFWHGHDCAKGRAPKSRVDYWGPKLAANKARDDRSLAELHALGWDTLVVWQCELADIQAVLSRMSAFVDRPANSINKLGTNK